MVMSRCKRAGKSARRCGKAPPANANGEVTVKCSSNYRYALGKRLPHRWSVPAGGVLRRRQYLLDTNFQKSGPQLLHPREGLRAAECKHKEGGPLLPPVISLFRSRAQTSRASLYPAFVPEFQVKSSFPTNDIPNHLIWNVMEKTLVLRPRMFRNWSVSINNARFKCWNWEAISMRPTCGKRDLRLVISSWSAQKWSQVGLRRSRFAEFHVSY